MDADLKMPNINFVSDANNSYKQLLIAKQERKKVSLIYI